MKKIVLLSGPIGAGKTTVAKELVAISPEPVAYIEGDIFWSFIAKNGPGASRQKNFKIIMTSMIAAALPYAVVDYEVIVDFSIPPWFLNKARELAARRDIPLDYVVLRPSIALCAERAATRCEGTIADYTPYCALYESFDEAAAHIVSDDNGSVADIARKVREGIDEGRFMV